MMPLACSAASTPKAQSGERVVLVQVEPEAPPAPVGAAPTSNSTEAPQQERRFDDYCRKQPHGDEGIRVSCEIFGAEMFSLLAGHDDVTHLELLFLGGMTSDGEILESGVVDLAALPALPAVTNLHLAGDLRGIAGIERLSTLKEVTLALPEAIDTSPLLKLPNLRQLSLLSSVTDLATLEALTELEELHLRGSFDLGILAKMSRLRVLELDGSFQGHRGLHGLKALREIIFVETGPSDKDRRALTKALPNASISGP